MKKILFVALILSVSTALLYGKCINSKHQKIRDGSKYYSCLVKSEEVGNFDNGYCKKCGCHMSDHDNLQR